jgi:hypothetical protein
MYSNGSLVGDSLIIGCEWTNADAGKKRGNFVRKK